MARLMIYFKEFVQPTGLLGNRAALIQDFHRAGGLAAISACRMFNAL